MYHNQKLRFIFLNFAFLLLSNFAFSQTNEIAIRFIGNCGLYMTDGDLKIYIDFPYKSGAHNYMEYDAAEINNLKENALFIFTHKHADHFSPKQVKFALNEKNGTKYGPWNIAELENLGQTNPNFSIKAFKTKHLFTFNHYSYLITWHGKKIFISGDTESADTILQIKDMDWAFIPAWIVSDIVEKEKELDAKKIAIYHIGPKDTIQITGPRILMLKKQGEMISIPY